MNQDESNVGSNGSTPTFDAPTEQNFLYSILDVPSPTNYSSRNTIDFSIPKTAFQHPGGAIGMWIYQSMYAQLSDLFEDEEDRKGRK